MWIRSEFGRLCNLEQASEVTISNGTVEARFGQEVCPLAHRATEADALKVFDRITQDLSNGKRLLDLSKRAPGEPAADSTTEGAPPSDILNSAGDKEKAL